MPERAEIEAVARIVRDELPYAVKHSTATRIAERAIAALARCRALDRVRHARGDDECSRGRHEWAVSGDPATTCVRCGVPWAARSPQGEDHEPCPTCGGRGWHTAGGNDPMACGRCEAGERWSQGEDRGPAEDGIADWPKEPLGPQGEDHEAGPEPDALGGVPPSQPEEDKR